jgi:hypothetical protein
MAGDPPPKTRCGHHELRPHHGDQGRPVGRFQGPVKDPGCETQHGLRGQAARQDGREVEGVVPDCLINPLGRKPAAGLRRLERVSEREIEVGADWVHRELVTGRARLARRVRAGSLACPILRVQLSTAAGRAGSASACQQPPTLPDANEQTFPRERVRRECSAEAPPCCARHAGSRVRAEPVPANPTLGAWMSRIRSSPSPVFRKL